MTIEEKITYLEELLVKAREATYHSYVSHIQYRAVQLELEEELHKWQLQQQSNPTSVSL